MSRKIPLQYNFIESCVDNEEPVTRRLDSVRYMEKLHGNP